MGCVEGHDDRLKVKAVACAACGDVLPELTFPGWDGTATLKVIQSPVHPNCGGRLTWIVEAP